MSRKAQPSQSEADRRSAAVAQDVEVLRVELADVKAQLKTLVGAVQLQAERLDKLSRQRGGPVGPAAVKTLHPGPPATPAPIAQPQEAPRPVQGQPEQVKSKPFDPFRDDDVPHADAGPSRWGD